MQTKNQHSRSWSTLCMVLLGTGATAAAVVLRVLLMPLLRDTDTGRFSANIPAMAVMLLTLAALAVLALFAPRKRVDIPPSGALSTSLAGIFAGALLGAVAAWEGFRWLVKGILPSPAEGPTGVLLSLVLLATLVFGVLGAVALIRWGLQVISESGTRRGMSAWSALAPVLWAWFRLARYEMSYASTVGWTQRFYDFFMVILELLFLFKLARFVSGIGKATLGELLFYAMGAAMFALSGTLTRVCLYFSTDSEAYLTTDLAGLADFGIGVLALTFGWSLVRAYRALPPQADPDELSDDDTPYDPSLEPLLLVEDEETDAEYNEP